MKFSVWRLPSLRNVSFFIFFYYFWSLCCILEWWIDEGELLYARNAFFISYHFEFVFSLLYRVMVWFHSTQRIFFFEFDSKRCFFWTHGVIEILNKVNVRLYKFLMCRVRRTFAKLVMKNLLMEGSNPSSDPAVIS